MNLHIFYIMLGTRLLENMGFAESIAYDFRDVILSNILSLHGLHENYPHNDVFEKQLILSEELSYCGYEI